MNNNKLDGQNKSATDNLRMRGMEAARNSDKKRRFPFLMVDLFLLIGVIAVLFALVLAFTPLQLFGDDSVPQQIVYTVEFYGVDKDMEHAFREGDTVVNAQTGTVMGVVTQVSSRIHETYTDIPTDEIVPEFDKYVVQKERNEEWRVVTVSIQATAEYQSGVGYTVQSDRIAVGREYQLRFPSYVDGGTCVSLTQASAKGEVSD